MSKNKQPQFGDLPSWNKRVQQQEQAFRNLWLPAIDPNLPQAFRQETPLPLLRDLYPNIWRYGPRGDIYLTQLTDLVRLFDRFNDDDTLKMERYYFIQRDLPAFNRALDIARYTHRSDIDRAVKNEQRPKYPFHFTGDSDRYPIYGQLRHHVMFDGSMTSNVEMGVFITNFTYHSLYRDIIARFASNAGLVQKWERYCHAWDLSVC